MSHVVFNTMCVKLVLESYVCYRKLFESGPIVGGLCLFVYLYEGVKGLCHTYVVEPYIMSFSSIQNLTMYEYVIILYK